ncbi:ABC transporter permease [Vulcanisaeta sp. JCM 16161]|uniref:ABC transporter permease n=1 Tax=Vulcanisaeta sp. JCM 16161 TaxID=1295372 RepID=UPI0006D0EE5C|nr:ABC transporter permease [Vulcanisaeta sp. JCM 16161]
MPETGKIKSLFRSIFDDRSFLTGFIMFFPVIMLAIIGPIIAPYKHPDAVVGPPGVPPSSHYLLGTTLYGQDVWSQLLFATPATLIIAAMAGAIATAIGIVLGVIAGYFGRTINDIINFFTNLFIAIPVTLFVMILSLVIGPKISNLLVAILTGLFSWSWTVRAVDPMTRSIKARDFINVARLNGSDSFEIAFGEILPVILPYVVIVYIIQFNAAIMTIVTLNLFGIGSLSIVTWGTMLYWSVIATAFAYGIWWWYVPPGFLTAWTTLALILMVRGLNKIFNPRLRG